MTASVRSASYDASARTVEVVAATDAPVGMYLYPKGDHPTRTWGRYAEALDMSGADLARMPGAPFLLDHWAYTADQIGVVQEARVEGGNLVCKILLGETARGDLETDIANGVRTQISIGYDVHEHVVEDRDGDVPLARAVSWTPLEVSLVAIGADPGAHVRSHRPPAGTPESRTAPPTGAPDVTDTTNTPAAPEAPADDVAGLRAAIDALSARMEAGLAALERGAETDATDDAEAAAREAGLDPAKLRAAGADTPERMRSMIALAGELRASDTTDAPAPKAGTGVREADPFDVYARMNGRA